MNDENKKSVRETPPCNDEASSDFVTILFLPDDIVIEAQPGEALLTVAAKAGVFIPTGCLMGSCHACEVELGDGTPICACISSVPLGTKHLTIHLYADPVW